MAVPGTLCAACSSSLVAGARMLAFSFFVCMIVEQADMYQDSAFSLFEFCRVLTMVYHSIVSLQDLVHCTVFKIQKLRNCSVFMFLNTEWWIKFRKWMVLCHYVSPSCGNSSFRIHWCLSVMIRVNACLIIHFFWEWQKSIFYFCRKWCIADSCLAGICILE